jgi:hypothetical protein
MHFAAYRGGLAEGGVYLLPVNGIGAGGLRQQQRSAECE